MRFHINQTLLTGSYADLHRATDSETSSPCIIKMTSREFPTPDQLNRIQHEYEITGMVAGNGVLKSTQIVNTGYGKTIVFENFEGDLLLNILKQRSHPLSIEQKLRIGISLAEIAGQVHAGKVIHKDIHPGNILYNPETGEIKITSFHVATRLEKGRQQIKPPANLEGTLAYMSPEQTGRMNRSVDYRTDIYSTGILLYEMFTGSLPFIAEDDLSLIYAHIAKEPVPPHAVDESVPEMVSRIIMKCLSKSAEDRYSSDFGLQCDLSVCLGTLDGNGDIELFEPGIMDFSTVFQIPEKLYGREGEIALMFENFERIRGSRAEMLLVAGYSGTGKSALVSEIQKKVLEEIRIAGFFIGGKFEQYHRDIPYKAIAQAFQSLVRQLLMQPEDAVAAWKERISSALGVNGQVIIEYIPELALVAGEQQPVPELSPAESQNRFNMTFRNLLDVFATEEHPLVLFLDDIHWADAASLNLIRGLLLDSQMKSLLVIGTYRDNEKEAAERLNLVVDEINEAGTFVTRLKLKPLSEKHVRQMLSETLHCPLPEVKDLSEVVMSRTEGNQFFVHEFIKSLHAEQLISCRPESGKWEWNLSQIRSKKVTGNVVELMTAKITLLSDRCQTVLKYGACIGNTFDLFTLKSIHNKKSMKQIVPSLWEAVQSGLLITSDDDYKYFQRNDVNTAMDMSPYEKMQFSFLHDRVHQAAYELCRGDEAAAIQIQLARLMCSQLDDNEREDHLFDIANHFMAGAGLIEGEGEERQYRNYCLKAGIKAKGSGAYEGALRYLSAGMEMLTGNSWEQDYSTTWLMTYHRAECEYLNRNFDQADIYIGVLLKNADNTLDKLKVYNLKTVMLISKFQDKEAIENGIEGLKLMNIHLAPYPEKGDVDDMKSGLEKLCGRTGVSTALLKNRMADPEQLAVLQLMTEMMVPSYYTRLEFLYVLLLKMIELTAKHGWAEMSCVGFMFYAFTLINRFDDYEQARAFAALSMELCEKEECIRYRGKVYTWYSGIVSHWLEHVEQNMKYSLRGKEYAIEYGDLNSFNYSINFRGGCALFSGMPLNDVYAILADYSINSCVVMKRAIIALGGRTSTLDTLSGEDYDEGAHVEAMKQFASHVPIYIYYFVIIRNLYLAGKYSECIETGQYAEKYYNAGTLNGVFGITEIHLFHALALTAIYPEADEAARKNYMPIIRGKCEWFKTLKKHCPENYSDKYLLLSAEYCRITGKKFKAMKLYDEAVTQASENGYLNNEALINELAGKYYLSIGRKKIALMYLNDAYELYKKWQGTGKARLLQEQYSLGRAVRNTDGNLSETGNLDLYTVLKASQTISGEIVFKRLLQKLMEILIENAGARKGILFLRNGGKLVMEAIASVREGKISVQIQPAYDETAFPNDLIMFVNRTGNEVILNRACEEGAFVENRYISQNNVKSILCAPIKPQGKMRGVFYLENELSFDIFTPDRLNVLQILSSQAAISIENAGLYSSIEQKVEERTFQLKEANKEIKEANQEIRDANKEIRKLNALLEKENIRMSSELDVARQIQQMVLPSDEELQVVELLDIACLMKPADEVGGDYYDVIQQDGSVLIGIGDVTDHGLKSGVLMLMVQTAVQALMKQGKTDRRQLMETLNQTIYLNTRRMKTDRNLTLALLQYRDGKIHVTGQHEEVLVVRKNRTLEIVETMELGFPVGLKDEIGEFLNESVIEVEPGDGIVVFTDGITEAENMDGEQYGLKRLCGSIVENWDKCAEDIRNEVTEDCLKFIGEQKVFDDITLVVAKVR